MDLKKIGASAVGISGAVLACILLKKRSATDAVKTVAEAVPEPEQMFGGVPLSKLTELAQQIYHGINCTIDQYGFLIFHHKSNRGHQLFHTQMKLDSNGKLINLGGHYPGQIRSGADIFAEKANELFQFKK